MKKFLGILVFCLLWINFNANANEINKNLLVLVKYQSKNLNVEILQYPFYVGPRPTHQGPASYKITDNNTNKTLWIPVNFTSSMIDLGDEFKWSEDKEMIYRSINGKKLFLDDPSPKREDGKNYDEKKNEYTYGEVGSWTFANNLVNLHKENKLSDVLIRNSELDLGYVYFCKKKNYFTKTLSKEFIHEETDKCYYVNFDSPVSLFDVDFDNQNEILIVLKYEGQRWSDQILVYELDGKEHSSIYKELDSHGTSINITKKLISAYASGGYCRNHYDIFKIVNKNLTLSFKDGKKKDETEQCKAYLEKIN